MARFNKREWILVLSLLLLGWAARAWLLWGDIPVPGINGAYYLVQDRSLLERGRLALPDLPLVFHIQSLIAMTLPAPLETAIVWAVKLCDALLPPLAAVPVLFLGLNWARQENRGALVPWLAAAHIAAGGVPLSMVGDFQKNSLALVWMAWLLWALRQWAGGSPGRRSGMAMTCALLLALTGLTHIGVFGTSLLLAGLWWLGLMAASRRREPSRWGCAGLGLAVVLCVSYGVYRGFDSERVLRLREATLHPVRFLIATGPPPPPGMTPPGMAPPPPPPLPQFIPWALLLLLVMQLRRRPVESVPDQDLVRTCGVGALLLSCPCLPGDLSGRLCLNAYIPALIVAQFALLRLRSKRGRAVFTGLLFLAWVASAIPILTLGRPSMVTPSALREFDSIAAAGLITDPPHTLIVAPHGLEWWAAWKLHVRIVHRNSLQLSDWEHYQVMFLELKEPPHPPGLPPRGPMPGPFAMMLPDKARVIFSGEALTLARLDEAPASPP